MVQWNVILGRCLAFYNSLHLTVNQGLWKQIKYKRRVERERERHGYLIPRWGDRSRRGGRDSA